MAESIRAEIRDPLWMLSRQWQMHEFRGEDAGSPVQVDVHAEHETISRTDLAPGVDPDSASTLSYDGTVPLETLIEREDVMLDRQKAESGMRRAAEAGLYFLRLLHKKGFTSSDGSEAYIAEDFPSTLRLEEPTGALPQSDRRYASLMAGRALDGVTIFQRLVEAVPDIRKKTIDWNHAEVSKLPLPEDRTSSFEPSANTPFTEAAEEYIEWYCTLYSEPTASGNMGSEEEKESTRSAWIPERLEYDAAVTVGEGSTETVFAVPKYEGGRLDWDSFSVVDKNDPDADPTPVTTEENRGQDDAHPAPEEPPDETGPPQISALPTQITFPGMPVPRWWELEEASSVLSSVSARGALLPRLRPIRISREFGNDWFALPLDVPVGSFTRITTLTVTDSFGVPHTARPAVKSDDGFELFMSHTPAHSEPGLFVPPTLGDVVTSDPIEDVVFARDEQANLAFGIERTVENSVGGVMNRDEFQEPKLHIDEIVMANETETNDITAPDVATSRQESVTFSNPGDDALDISGWRMAVSPITSTESPVTFNDYEFDTELEAGHSLKLVAISEPSEAPETPDKNGGTDVNSTTETRQMDFGASLVRAAAISVYAPPFEKTSGADNTTSGRLVAKRVLQRPPEALADYRLATNVPDHWFPFEPTDVDDDKVAERLERSVLLDASTFGVDPEYLPTPRGEILDPDPELLQPIATDGTRPSRYLLYEEEVPPSGRRVTRNYQLARWIDGSTHLWVGRCVAVGRGEASSGLEFDVLEQSDEMSSGVSFNNRAALEDR